MECPQDPFLWWLAPTSDNITREKIINACVHIAVVYSHAPALQPIVAAANYGWFGLMNDHERIATKKMEDLMITIY